MRIVSLIASATEIVHALGLGDFQVGRSHECDFPDSVRKLPVCTRPRFDVSGSSADIDRLVKQTLAEAGSVYEILDPVLSSLAPTHILTQSQCKVCAVSVDEVQQSLSRRWTFRPQVVALEPNTLADVWEDVRRVGRACGAPKAAEDAVGAWRQTMQAIAARAHAATRRPSVAVIEWIEPLMAAGNWVPELVEMAGGINQFGQAGRHSPWLDWEQLLAADPHVLIVSPCGFDLARTRSEMHWLSERPQWRRLRSVRQGRVYLAEGNQFFHRPGPRLVESLQILAEILHPEEFAPKLEGVGWERF